MSGRDANQLATFRVALERIADESEDAIARAIARRALDHSGDSVRKKPPEPDPPLRSESTWAS